MNEALVEVLSVDPQASSAWWLKRVEGLRFPFEQVHDRPEVLDAVKARPRKHIFIDTPGSLEDEHLLAKALRYADDVIIPMPAETLAFDATTRTITQVIMPRGLSYRVVVNNWDPRDGVADRDDTIAFVDANEWRRTQSTVRRYKIHTRAPLEGRVVTQYPRNRVALEARQDITKLALELGYGWHDDPEPRVHVIANQKGGAGKTTLTVCLAAIVDETLHGGS